MSLIIGNKIEFSDSYRYGNWDKQNGVIGLVLDSVIVRKDVIQNDGYPYATHGNDKYFGSIGITCYIVELTGGNIDVIKPDQIIKVFHD